MKPMALELHGVEIPRAVLDQFCARNHIHKLSLFGSILTSDFRPDSDVDILVEFEPGTRVSYFDLVRMEMELSAVIGRKVDLRTPEELSKYFRDKVIASALRQYERS